MRGAALQLGALAYNLGRLSCVTAATLPDTVEQWLLTPLREKLVNIGAKVVSHGLFGP